uniref:Odorant receptor n=1 Tax=Phlebotomus papatasi TaxID=29031 RepID=A0A240SYG1_PHLPP
MSEQLTMFAKEKSLVEYHLSILTFSVTSGPLKNRLSIILGVIAIALCTVMIICHLKRSSGDVDLNYMMALLATAGFSEYLMKCVCGIYKSKEFWKLFEEIEHLYQDEESDEELTTVLAKHLKKSMEICNICYIWIDRIYIASGAMASIQLRLDDNIIIELPFISTDDSFKDFLYVFQTCLIIVGILYMSKQDKALVFVGVHIIAELYILHNYMKLLNEKINILPNFLKTIISKHCNAIENIKLLNKSLYEIAFVQFSFSTVILLINLMFMRNVASEIACYLIFTCGILQVFPLCLFGEFIKMKTEKLSETLYLTNWYDLSLKDQKTFLIILTMAHREYGLKAAGLYDVNVYAFVQIVKIAMSYCAILYTLSK